MSTYLNIKIQANPCGVWLDKIEFSDCGPLRDVFSRSSIYDTDEKGFPEGVEDKEHAWGKTWYTRDEIVKFLDTAKNALKEHLNDIQNNNMYEVFQGILNKEKFEDIKYNFKKVGFDSDESEESYFIQEYTALSGLLMMIDSLGYDEVRVLVWFD